MLNGKFWAIAAVVAVLSYLIGSVSFAVIVSRVGAQDDVRTHGSGNAGMTNMLRSYGKKLAFFTALGDFGKGLVAVALGRMIFSLADITVVDGAYIAGICVILGHLYPLYFGFKGGKGVLTSLGAALLVTPWSFVLIAAVLVPFVFIVKIVSLASVIGFGVYPFVTLLIDWLTDGPMLEDLIFSLLVGGMGIYKHRSNIQRLRSGTEYRFGQKKKEENGG